MQLIRHPFNSKSKPPFAIHQPPPPAQIEPPTATDQNPPLTLLEPSSSHLTIFAVSFYKQELHPVHSWLLEESQSPNLPCILSAPEAHPHYITSHPTSHLNRPHSPLWTLQQTIISHLHHITSFTSQPSCITSPPPFPPRIARRPGLGQNLPTNQSLLCSVCRFQATPRAAGQQHPTSCFLQHPYRLRPRPKCKSRQPRPQAAIHGA